MATKAFDYALEDVDLVRKAVNALRGLASNTATRKHAIRDLQILEAVLRGVQEVSLGSACEETLRNLHYCSHFCRPPLNEFLRRLKELEPDICHALACEEPSVEIEPAPVWATRLGGEVAVLQRSVGTGLRVIDLLLRVETMRHDLAANTALPEDLQQIIEALQEHLHGPVKRHVGPGHHYNNIQNSGGYSHYGDKYFFNSAPPSALIQAMSKKLDDTAGVLQIGQVIAIGEDLKGMLPQGVTFTCVEADKGSEPSTTRSADVQPFIPQSTELSATELAKLLLQCLLEFSRKKLHAILAMLLWTIPAFRAFIRSLSILARQPSMLLDNNIRLIDALNREVSLPYQWFRKWPHMLAHLQYEFKGTPGEFYVSESRFDMFRDFASSRSQSPSRIPLDQWEESMSPGILIVMSMRLHADKFDSRVCPSCKRSSVMARGTNEWLKCKNCGKFVLSLAETPNEHVSARYALRPRQPSMKDDLKTGQAEEEDIRHFSRVHGPALLNMGPVADEPVTTISTTSSRSSSRSSMSSVPSKSLLKSGYKGPNERVFEWLDHLDLAAIDHELQQAMESLRTERNARAVRRRTALSESQKRGRPLPEPIWRPSAAGSMSVVDIVGSASLTLAP